MRPVYYRSQAEREFAMCRSKTPFGTEREAKKANSRMRVYRCPLCDYYHLTSQGSNTKR